MPDEPVGQVFIPAVVAIGTPPRGGGTQGALTFTPQSFKIRHPHGSAPARAVIEYIGDAPVTRGARVTITMGAHFFAGLCYTDTANSTSRGAKRTLVFQDFRDYLQWDYVFCAFNKLDYTNINGIRQKRYWHIYPASFDTLTKTYTAAPLAGWQIISAILGARVPSLPGGFNGGTVGTPWTWDLSGEDLFPGGVLNAPIYDFDALGAGKRLDAALNEVAGRLGVVFRIKSSPTNYYHLVFTRMGYGDLPGFPTASDDRRMGEALSGNATNVRVMGDRNRYQCMGVEMLPDWARAWEQFLVFDLFVEDVFNRVSDPATNVRYNAISGDTEGFIGRQMALADALQMTIRDYANIRDDASFRDFRKFSGRSRMEMPVKLYLETILFRAFRPNLTGITNRDGRFIPMDSLSFPGQLLCEVSHAMVSGEMFADLSKPADGNGYAIVKGYQVSADLFRTVKPEQFNVNLFTPDVALWQQVPFQIDDSGEGGAFIIFDEPVFVSTNLLTRVDGHVVLNAGFTLSVPAVRASFVVEAERYSEWFGAWPNVSRDTVEQATNLREELVLQDGEWYEIPYNDGNYAFNRAQEIADATLLCQYIYVEGGRKDYWDPSKPAAQFGTPLSSMVNRIDIETGPSGTWQLTDFTNERARDGFEPARDMERRTVQNTLFPGQAELRFQAEAAQKLAKGLKQTPGFVDYLRRYFVGAIGPDATPPQMDRFLNPAEANVLIGTPIRGKAMAVGSSNTKTLATFPAALTPDDKIFRGVTVRQNEKALGGFYVQSSGTVLARVMGPIEPNDPVGLAIEPTDWLIKDGTPSVGRVLQKITEAKVNLVKVSLGAGGGGANSNSYRVKGATNNYLVCHTWDGTTEGVDNVYIAKPFNCRMPATEVINGVTYNYTYRDMTTLNPKRLMSGFEEDQAIIPQWLVNDVIHAVPISFTGVTSPAEGHPPITLIEVSARCWARQ